MAKIRVILVAGLACINFVVFGQEYELEALTATRASRLVAESEDGATNLILPHVSSIDAKTAEELAARQAQVDAMKQEADASRAEQDPEQTVTITISADGTPSSR